MPKRPPRLCNVAGCGKYALPGRYRCEKHLARSKDEERKRDRRRGSAHSRGYDKRWQKFRIRYLQKNPLCVNHLKRGEVVPATVVDHIIPHKGDPNLFWDTDNMQSLCDHCHNSWKQKLERTSTDE